MPPLELPSVGSRGNRMPKARKDVGVQILHIRQTLTTARQREKKIMHRILGLGRVTEHRRRNAQEPPRQPRIKRRIGGRFPSRQRLHVNIRLRSRFHAPSSPQSDEVERFVYGMQVFCEYE